MKTTRWIKSAQAAAKTCDHKMPWARGARRAQMIARRQAAAKPLRASA